MPYSSRTQTSSWWSPTTCHCLQPRLSPSIVSAHHWLSVWVWITTGVPNGPLSISCSSRPCPRSHFASSASRRLVSWAALVSCLSFVLSALLVRHPSGRISMWMTYWLICWRIDFSKRCGSSSVFSFSTNVLLSWIPKYLIKIIFK